MMFNMGACIAPRRADDQPPGPGPARTMTGPTDTPPMIDRKQFDERIAALQAALRDKLHLRGASLERQVQRAGRLLPQRQRRAAATLLGARDWMDHPRLARLLDRRDVDAALADMNRHLDRIDPHERRKTAILRLLAGIVLNLMIFGALLFLLWQHVHPG